MPYSCQLLYLGRLRYPGQLLYLSQILFTTAGLYLFTPQHFMQEKAFTLQGLCIQPCGPNTGESLIKYHVFGPAVTIMRRVSQAGKIFSYFGRLSYPGRLLYYLWLSQILPFYLERKTSHARNVLYEQCSFPTLADSRSIALLRPIFFTTAGPYPFCLQ